MKVNTKVKGRHGQDTGFVFYSYDKGSAALEFSFRDQDYQIVDLTNTTFKILLTIEQDGQEKKFTAIDSQPIIDYPESGVVTYPLPDQLLNYEGEVKGYVYLDFEDGSHSDESAFTFTIIRSKIDSEIEEASEIYIKDFEQVKKEVFELAEREKEAIEALRPELEASVSQLDEQVQLLDQQVEVNQNETNRLLQLIENNGALTKKDFVSALTRGYFEFTRTINFVNKISGSLVENPNQAVIKHLWNDNITLPSPSTSIGEVGTGIYKTLAGEGTSGQFVNNGNHPEKKLLLYIRMQWNIVEEIKRWLGERYFDIAGADTLEKQVALIEKGVSVIIPSFYGYGRTFNKGEKFNYQLTGLWYDNQIEEWQEYVRSTKDKYNTIKETVIKKANQLFLDNQGRVNILMLTGEGDDTGLYYGETTLEFTYRIYLSDILYYKRDPTIDRMQTQIQQLWNEVFKN